MANQQSIVTRLQDWLVGAAIGSEIKKAGLRRDTARLPFGDVSYLRSDRFGTGTAVMMLHGAAADNTTWLSLAKELKAADLPLLIPDLPGHGNSSFDPAASYSIGAQAQRLVQLLGALNLNRVHLVASSMSGAIAIKLAADFPALVSSLVLIGSMGMRARESWLERHIAQTGRNPMINVRNKADYLDMLRIGMNKPPFMPGFALSSLARSFVSRASINQKITSDIEADLDQGDNVGKVSCPALLIWGREDRIADISAAQRLHEQWEGSKLAILDGIGHVPMVEAPREVASLCRSFLAQTARATATA